MSLVQWTRRTPRRKGAYLRWFRGNYMKVEVTGPVRRQRGALWLGPLAEPWILYGGER